MQKKAACFVFYFILCALLFSYCTSFAFIAIPFFPTKNVYFGVNMGGGSTEWKYLVDTIDPRDTSVTTPSAVTEGGPSWGIVLGYAVNKNFALEAQYIRFADAKINLYSDSPYPIANMISKTDAYSVSAKFLAQVWQTHLRAFAAIGAGLVERRDPLVGFDSNKPFSGADKQTSCITPYLSSGLVYYFMHHWMVEGGFQYYTGFGKSQLDPVSSFIPFAWDAYMRLAYQI